MKLKMILAVTLGLGLNWTLAQKATAAEATEKKFSIFADHKDLQKLHYQPLMSAHESGVVYAELSQAEIEKLQEFSHDNKKCGGFEMLSQDIVKGTSAQKIKAVQESLNQLDQLTIFNQFLKNAPFKALAISKKVEIENAVEELSVDNIKETVQWLSAYPSRNSNQTNPNVHVLEMKKRLEALVAGAAYPVTVSLINHTQTKQNSIRVHIEGKDRPNEIVVLGGHFDSINSSFGGKTAPGADDNASGSADVLETLRVVLTQDQPQRSIEFFWYAAEEQGLVGSAEIAKSYKAAKKDVVAVLQLDMTLFPGDGELVIGSMTDFTSSWLRDLLVQINNHYVHGQIVEDQCGYGCSDHASWYRQGYPTLMPFEATMSTMNHNIHTARDIIDTNSNFDHALGFAKIALAYVMELSNSSLRQPVKLQQ